MLASIRRHFQPTENQELQKSRPAIRPVPISQSLQTKFNNGVLTNLRILICGTEKSGKSSLLRRLKGEPHQIEYIETKEEINGATVNWNYKATTEVIKVDAWEMKNDSYTQYYRGSSAMMFMYNANEAYDLEKILTQIRSVPTSIPVLIISNCMDLNPICEGDEVERVSQLSQFRTTPVYFCQSSMATGRGLNMIYKFLNVPYLYIREKELQRSLENIKMEYSGAKQEIDILQVEQSGNSSAPKSPRPSDPKSSDPSSGLVLADDDEISDSEDLFNTILIVDRLPDREIEGEKAEEIQDIKNDSDTDSILSDSVISNDLKVRVRPVGQSPELSSLVPPVATSSLEDKSPDLRAPLAVPDSPFSQLGELSSLYTNQSSQDSDLHSGGFYDGINLINSSTNNFLFSEESESTDSQLKHHF